MKSEYTIIMKSNNELDKKLTKLSQYRSQEADSLILKLIEDILRENKKELFVMVEGFIYGSKPLSTVLLDDILVLFEQYNAVNMKNIHGRKSSIYTAINDNIEKQLLKSPSEPLMTMWFNSLDKEFIITQDVRCNLAKGLYLYRKDKFDAALPYFKKGAKINCAESMQLIGLYHEQGLAGVEKNIFEAAQWNIKSGFKGNIHHDLELWVDDDEIDYKRFGDCNIKKVAEHLLLVTPPERIKLVELINKVEHSHLK